MQAGLGSENAIRTTAGDTSETNKCRFRTTKMLVSESGYVDVGPRASIPGVFLLVALLPTELGRLWVREWPPRQ